MMMKPIPSIVTPIIGLAVSLLFMAVAVDAASSPLIPSTTIRFRSSSQSSPTTSTSSQIFRRSRGWNSILQSIPRGGASLAVDSDGSEDIDSDDELSDEEEDELSESELNNLDLDSNSNSEEEEEEEEESASSTSSSSTPTTTTGPPVKLSIKTGLATPLVDQHLEFTASRTRSILSIKTAISKTMIGRPPISSIQLKYHGRVLLANDDDECINDLLEDYDSDDEDDDDTDTIGEDEDDDEDTIKLSLVADIVPPIDSKFGIEFRDRVHKMSTREILEAYCINMAGMVYGQELHVQECENLYNDNQDEGDDDEDEEEHTSSSTAAATENHSLNIRKKAALLQSQFESTLSDETKQLIKEEHERVKNASSSTDAAVVAVEDGGVVYGLVPQGSGSAVRSHRKGRTLKGGATMNVKRSLQRNLNVVCLLCVFVLRVLSGYTIMRCVPFSWCTQTFPSHVIYIQITELGRYYT